MALKWGDLVIDLYANFMIIIRKCQNAFATINFGNVFDVNQSRRFPFQPFAAIEWWPKTMADFGLVFSLSKLAIWFCIVFALVHCMQ